MPALSSLESAASFVRGSREYAELFKRKYAPGRAWLEPSLAGNETPGAARAAGGRRGGAALAAAWVAGDGGWPVGRQVPAVAGRPPGRGGAATSPGPELHRAAARDIARMPVESATVTAMGHAALF